MNVRKGGGGGTPLIRNFFFGKNFVRKGGGGTPLTDTLTDKIRKVVFDLLPKGATTRILAKCTCPYAGLKFTSQRPRKHLVMMKMVVVVKELKVWYLYLYCFKFEYT